MPRGGVNVAPDDGAATTLRSWKNPPLQGGDVLTMYWDRAASGCECTLISSSVRVHVFLRARNIFENLLHVDEPFQNQREGLRSKGFYFRGRPVVGSSLWVPVQPHLVLSDSPKSTGSVARGAARCKGLEHIVRACFHRVCI